MAIVKDLAIQLRIIADLIDCLEEVIGPEPNAQARELYGEMIIGYKYQMGYEVVLGGPYIPPSSELPAAERIEKILEQLPDCPMLRMSRAFVPKVIEAS